MLGQGLKRGATPVLARGLSSSAAVQAALPAVANEATSGGFLSKLFGGGGSRVSTPMTEPMEGVNLPIAEPPVTQAPQTQVTKLGNGVQIASEATPVSDQRCWMRDMRSFCSHVSSRHHLLGLPVPAQEQLLLF